MGLTRTTLRATAKELAQDQGADTATGVKLLLTDPGDYNEAIAQALRIFEKDQPNIRVTDYVVAATGFRFPLFGAGNVVPNNPNTPAAPVAALVVLAGNVNNGTHSWKVTIRTTDGETAASLKSNVLNTVGGSQQADIPLPTLPMNGNGWGIYRTITGDGGNHKLVAYQAGAGGASGTVYRDNVADANLGADAPTVSTAVSANAWVDGYSYIERIWWPYDDANQATEAVDENAYRLRLAPSGAVYLEFVSDRPATNDVLRLEYAVPHKVDDTDESKCTVRSAHEEAVKVLTASVILQLAANKAAQNTGNTGLPNDVVDRRSQSDIYRSRSKELRDLYNVLVGKGGTENIKPASAVKDLDVESSHRLGFLWHPNRLH